MLVKSLAGTVFKKPLLFYYNFEVEVKNSNASGASLQLAGGKARQLKGSLIHARQLQGQHRPRLPPLLSRYRE